MFWTFLVTLIQLWLMGLLCPHTMEGFIHLLLTMAIIMMLVRLIQGQRII